MSSIPRRVLNNLRRPMPDLFRYLIAKVLSALWRPHLKHVGRSFHVDPGAQFQGGASIAIGDNFRAGPMLWVEAVRSYLDFRFDPVIDIGSNVVCSQSVHIAATNRVTIHDGVLLGSHVHITDHAHGTYSGTEQDAPTTPPSLRRPATGQPVVIGANVWLGDGVVVLPGVTIGEGSIVGANSVVSRDLPPEVIAVGAPAVPIKCFDRASGRWLSIPIST
jgi:acetyltransferase-like isoleucine patch superfamily enzyme